ncbi:bifunctional 5,10-methylenetetrahydrofolate dehydrogenase/5,10-methenyltetrahydrofolate cyclohydrolase [Actinopolymorpha sp. B9G3]|uniref:bifunctional 5,10-methylenetetrahydrofolate dehydrogenase/5,10-methenyltetrahydrofolate cyclohydrolase n=1 Tax=Actinopolymorpha sp. B9G3 TaxID=3158970 RepID=UPI0032D8F19D
MSTLIDGRAIAAAVNARTTRAAERLRGEPGEPVVPTLAIVVPTDDEGTAWYVRSIRRTGERVGVDCQVDSMVSASGPDIARRLAELSADPSVHGVVCQTPLPTGTTLSEVAGSIVAAKDVDGANPTSLGMVAAGISGAFAPATAAAVMEILRSSGVALSGRRAVVVGRSTVVGKPTALLLLAEHATVTVCHSRTSDLAAVCREADVLVAAVGWPGLIDASHVRPGAVVIDVGTNPTPDGELVGDVDAEAVGEVAGALTPVPGGVGPVTTAMLLHHTVQAAARLSGSVAARQG